MRASVLVMGPLLARMFKASVSLPGGCAIGARPINYHLQGFKKLGAAITIKGGYVQAACKKLKGARIVFPFASVGATENVLMAAVLAKGRTVIKRAAREPEIVDLGNMLNDMGARIKGLGTATLIVDGVEALYGTTHTVIPDRIETGTFLVAAAVTRGDITLKKSDLGLLESVAHHLKKAGLSIQESNGSVRAKWVRPLKPVHVTTQVYPGFPTDMQAQWIALMSLTKGRTQVRETVFENRFLHVQELLRFGGDIRLDGRVANINGVRQLSGCSVMVSDLRAGAALVLAGLAAQGTSTILRIYHLDRGYDHIEKKLRALGAQIKRSNPVKKNK